MEIKKYIMPEAIILGIASESVVCASAGNEGFTVSDYTAGEEF